MGMAEKCKVCGGLVWEGGRKESFLYLPGLGILPAHLGFVWCAASEGFRPFPKSESPFPSSNWKGRRYHSWCCGSEVVNLGMLGPSALTPTDPLTQPRLMLCLHPPFTSVTPVTHTPGCGVCVVAEWAPCYLRALPRAGLAPVRHPSSLAAASIGTLTCIQSY